MMEPQQKTDEHKDEAEASLLAMGYPHELVAKKLAAKQKEEKHEKAVSRGLKIMQEGFVKVDHFEHIYRLSPIFDGCPNLRQVRGFHIFGSGQPTKSSIDNLSSIWFDSMNINNILWINMRTEPVIYVKDISVAPRESSHPSENIDFGPEDILSIKDVNLFQSELEKTIKKNINNYNKNGKKNIFEYHKDTYAPLPADRKDMILTMECPNGSDDVFSLLSLYKTFKNIQLERITVGDERAPNTDDIVKMVNILRKKTNNKTCLIFNCQMGKGRTTEGMIIGCLIRRIEGYFDEKLFEKEQNIVKWSNDIPIESEEDTSFNKKIEKKLNNNKLNEADSSKMSIDSADKSKSTMSVNVDESDQSKMSLDEAKIGDSVLSKDEMKKGNFTIIKDLVIILKKTYNFGADEIRKEVDDIINRCQHLTNMRECIYLSKRRYFNEDRIKQRSYWQQMAKQFLERYYVLIVFNAYLNNCNYDDDKKFVKYDEWIKNHSKISANIGSLSNPKSRISQFNWD